MAEPLPTINLTDALINEEQQTIIDLAGSSAPEIKTKYESNLDTNEFSDAEEAQVAEIPTKISSNDYATSTVGGVIKIRLTGTDCFITTDGTNP